MNRTVSNNKFKSAFNKYNSYFRRHGGTENTAACAFCSLGWDSKDEQTRQEFRLFVDEFGKYRKREIVTDKEMAAFILACVEWGFFDDTTNSWDIMTINELNQAYIRPINTNIIRGIK